MRVHVIGFFPASHFFFFLFLLTHTQSSSLKLSHFFVLCLRARVWVDIGDYVCRDMCGDTTEQDHVDEQDNSHSACACGSRPRRGIGCGGPRGRRCPTTITACRCTQKTRICRAANSRSRVSPRSRSGRPPVTSNSRQCPTASSCSKRRTRSRQPAASLPRHRHRPPRRRLQLHPNRARLADPAWRATTIPTTTRPSTLTKTVMVATRKRVAEEAMLSVEHQSRREARSAAGTRNGAKSQKNSGVKRQGRENVDFRDNGDGG